MSSGKDHRKFAPEIVLKPRESSVLTSSPEIGDGELVEVLARLEALTTLADKICRPVAPRTIFENALVFVSDLLQAERAVFCVLGEDGDVRCAAGSGIDTSQPFGQWPISKNILRRVLDNQEAILSCDAAGDERFRQFKSVSAEQIRSLLCVPLLLGEKANGFIYLDSRMRSNCFREEDLRFLIAIARYVDLAVQSADRLEREREKAELGEERFRALQEELFAKHRVVGKSKGLLQAYKTLKDLAATDIPILLTGETGTGKELFAQAAHRNSPRANGPFIPVVISALSPTLVESELFGHEKDAFTGARGMKRGRLELADGGTLFLDEVGDIPPEIQVKLLRAIESKQFERVGGTRAVRADFRVVSATSRNLDRLVDEGQFRRDLYYRLVGRAVVLPPLRERTEDIPLLIEHFLKTGGGGGGTRRFSTEAVRLLTRYPWPGNVRELYSETVAHACTGAGAVIEAEDLHPKFTQVVARGGGFPTLADVLAETELRHFKAALAKAGGKDALAIELLGISRDKFYERKKRFRL